MKKEELISKLIVAGLEGDRAAVRLLGVIAARTLKKESPKEADLIGRALAHSDVGNSPLRAVGITPVPSDRETGQALVRTETTGTGCVPVFSSSLEAQISRFVDEQNRAEKMLALGISPGNTLLLVGPPGVGKTLLATSIAERTNRPLLSLDLATSVSSLLGKTGQNIRAALDYARSLPSVLLLDEFDSIAKRRDDETDLGELKRLVNVLLKELETWPPHSILIAATNHPQLLDRAIWRRFDLVIEIPHPGISERTQIIARSLGSEFGNPIIQLIATFTDNWSASDITRLCNRIRRRLLLEELEKEQIAIEELAQSSADGPKKLKGELCKELHKISPRIRYEQLATWLRMSISNVHYHIKGKQHEPKPG